MNRIKTPTSKVQVSKYNEETILKNEFNNLIKEISNEVISSTVSKSLSSTSEIINKQTPLINSATKLLNIESQKLQKTNTDIQNKLKNLNTSKIDTEFININKKLPASNRFYTEQNELIKDLKKDLFKNSGSLRNFESIQIENEERRKLHDAEINKKLDVLTVIGAVIIVFQLFFSF